LSLLGILLIQICHALEVKCKTPRDFSYHAGTFESESFCAIALACK
jgi:hypothetical protein